MPLISVIIPCYNSEMYVGRAIESVLKQSYKNLEIILVDNNSNDKTATILKSYAEANSNTIKIINEPRRGSPFARNKGLSESTGEWLQFLDSDDELLPDKLQHQIELAEKDSNIDLIAGSLFLISESAEGFDKKIVHVVSDNPWKNLIKSNLGKTSSILWKKDVVLAVGGWNEKITSSQEYELLFRLLQKNIHIACLDLPETNKYVISNSISRSDNNERTMEILNNYVDLRIAIKNYLISTQAFTKEMNHAVSTAIYLKLIAYKKTIPSYVKFKMQEINLKVPFHHVVNSNARKLRGRAKNFIKKFL
jgi:glycosyltransferase involved in cell wall biosynthesis